MEFTSHTSPRLRRTLSHLRPSRASRFKLHPTWSHCSLSSWIGIILVPFLVSLSLLAASSETSVTPTTKTETSSASTRLNIRGFEVLGNSALKPDRIRSVLEPFCKTNADFSVVREAMGALQLAYRSQGFATVSVTLPKQQVTNGIVRIQVLEGRLVDIRVQGNQHFSSNNVLRALPSLTTNVLINTRWFQPELDRANANVDRQIYPILGPGPDPGTTALTLRVKDREPLHGHVEVNNKATPLTPPLRVDANVQYNNLWQLEHQVGFQYNFSPQWVKSSSDWPRFWEQPLIASYSGFYRIPFSGSTGLRDTYEREGNDFGYDPVSRTFKLPPPTGRPEWIVFASRSSSENPVRLGPLNTITNSPIADIFSQFAQKDTTATEDVGTKFSLPLPEFAGFRSAVSLGLDWKNYRSFSYTTNVTYFNLYTIDGSGNRVSVTNQIIRLDANSGQTFQYLPISYGWAGSRSDKGGFMTFSLEQKWFFRSLSSDLAAWRAATGTSRSGGDFTTLSLSAFREQFLPGNWALLFRANGQWSSEPLVSNEQFGLGGTAGVRGYEEGESYGDVGWRSLLDVKSPPWHIGDLPKQDQEIPIQLRAFGFVDVGQRLLIVHRTGRVPRETMLGTGVGIFVTASEHFEARLTTAWALLDTTRTSAGDARAYFSIGIQF